MGKNLEFCALALLMAVATGCDDASDGDPVSADAAVAADGGPGGDTGALDASVGDVEVPAPPSPEVLAARLDLSRFAADLEFTARPRTPGSPHWQAVQDRCATTFAEAGFTVERHAYGTGTNVIGVIPGTTAPNEWVVVSGHYDHIAACAGADDNATGTAGVLEAARALGGQTYERTLVVACWDEEEFGYIGSREWVNRAKSQGVEVKASYVFETMGYFTDEPNTQIFPLGFEFIFPDAARMVTDRQSRGDFIAAIGDDIDPAPMADLQAGADRVDLPIVPILLNGPYRSDPSLGDLRRSDHAAFWLADWPAMMLSSTANFRNPNYHCTLGEDDIAQVDMERTFKVVQAATFAAARQARPAAGTPGALDTTTDPRAPVNGCDLLRQDCPAGQKCISRGTYEAFETACIPAGEVLRGGDCVRGATIGDDGCVAGTYCAFFGHPLGDPQPRGCHAYCFQHTDCAAGEVCVELVRSHHVGLCTPPCDPLDVESCGEGQACVRRSPALPGDWVTICEPSARPSRQRGEACGGTDVCLAGLYCVPSMVGRPSFCSPWCAADGDCADGEYCHPNGVADRGVCLPR